MATFTIINDSTATWYSNGYIIWDDPLLNYSWASLMAPMTPEQIRKEQEKKEFDELWV